MVRAENVVVRFSRGLRRGVTRALDGFDLEVHEGDFFALLGENGAGKSTAMHCFLGLLRPTSGRLEVMGQRPVPGAPVFASVGYLPEEPRYHEYLTIEEAVTYYARLSGVTAPGRRVRELIERLGLAEHRSLAIRKCSKGMKQKVGIAQCVIHSPRLLFLDEPMRGLDPMTVHLFREMLREMNAQGVTIVMSSHILSEVELVASRVAIIQRGRVVVQDEVAKLRATAGGQYVVHLEEVPDGAPYLLELSRSSSAISARLPEADLHPFMEYARSNGVRILSCALERQTLEERFVAIVKEGAHA